MRIKLKLLMLLAKAITVSTGLPHLATFIGIHRNLTKNGITWNILKPFSSHHENLFDRNIGS